MEKENIVSIEDRIPKLKQARKKKANRRLLFYLSIFFLLISIIIYLQSPLSQINQIDVTGNDVLSDNVILTKSGLDFHQNIWMVQPKHIAAKIEKHPLIKEVTVTRQLPQTVQVDVTEFHIIGYINEDNVHYPVLETGEVMSEMAVTNKGDGPLLNHFSNDTYLERISKELSEVPEPVFNMISEISWEPTDKNKYKIILYMNDGFIVEATIRNFASKMESYPSIVSQLDEGDQGIIHMGVGTYFEKMKD